MNTLEHTTVEEIAPLEQQTSPSVPLDILKEQGNETARAISQKQTSAESLLENSALSPEAKKTYAERIRKLSEKYTNHAAKLRNIAIVSLALSATPAFAQDEQAEKFEGSAVVSEIAPAESKHTEAVLREIQEVSVEAEPEMTEEDQAPDIISPEIPLSELAEVPNADTNSILMQSLEAIAKDKLEYIKENPTESGITFAAKFTKGPLQHIPNLIEVVKSLRDSDENKESPAETAKKVGRLLLDLKTFGLGGIVLDLLKSIPAAPAE